MADQLIAVFVLACIVLLRSVWQVKEAKLGNGCS
jgi:hypothetical protein